MAAEELLKDERAQGAHTPADLLDITVLMGGPSSEREVSLASGRAVANALSRCGHRVTTADISPDDLSALDRKGTDVVFIALHGRFGEDGQVQRLCEQRGLAYVGSGPVASQLALDKDASKRLFRGAGLATPEWIVIDDGENRAELADRLAILPLPCVLKPVDGGSSVDVTVARDEATRDEALSALLETYGRAIVEEFVAGREMTVGILADQPLPLIEIVPKRGFYDYFAKYQDEGTQYVVDPQVPIGVAERMLAEGLRVHQILGCRDLNRIDFLLTDDGRSYVLEANTIPGFTSHSLVPKAASAVGVSFDELCDRLALLAFRRARR